MALEDGIRAITKVVRLGSGGIGAICVVIGLGATFKGEGIQGFFIGGLTGAAIMAAGWTVAWIIDKFIE